MDFSPSALIAGLVFGVVGIYVFKKGKRELHFPQVFTGLTLMIYPYFVSGIWLTWGIGLALTALAYYFH